VVAEGCVVQLSRIEGFDHLPAAVVLAQQARAEHISGQYEEDRPLIIEALANGGNACQPSTAAGDGIGNVHIVDEQEPNRFERYWRRCAAHAAGQSQ
jgi:hypothetical protein